MYFNIKLQNRTDRPIDFGRDPDTASSLRHKRYEKPNKSFEFLLEKESKYLPKCLLFNNLQFNNKSIIRLINVFSFENICK